MKALRKVFTFMHLADAFIQSDLQATQYFSMCVPWELNLQPFVLLTQCSTTEPQKHVLPYFFLKSNKYDKSTQLYIYICLYKK